MHISESQLIGTLLVYLILIPIYTFLIMVIWNNILVQKVKGANLQKINFWESLGIGLFFSLISGRTTVINQICDK